ncbi:MAG: hypothetical protein ACK4M7_02145 [Burkholderiales bacterium]
MHVAKNLPTKILTFSQTKAILAQKMTPETKLMHLNQLESYVSRLFSEIDASLSQDEQQQICEQYKTACRLATYAVQEAKNKAGQLDPATITRAHQQLSNAMAKDLFDRFIFSEQVSSSTPTQGIAQSLDILCTHRNTVPLPFFRDRKLNFYGKEPNLTKHAIAFIDYVNCQSISYLSSPTVEKVVSQADINDLNNIVEGVSPSASFETIMRKIEEDLANLIAQAKQAEQVNSEFEERFERAYTSLVNQSSEIAKDKLLSAQLADLITSYSRIRKDKIFYLKGAMALLTISPSYLKPSVYMQLVIRVLDNFIKVDDDMSNEAIVRLLYQNKEILKPANYKSIVIGLIDKFSSLNSINVAKDAENALKLLEENQEILGAEYKSCLVRLIENFSAIDTVFASLGAKAVTSFERYQDHVPNASKAIELLDNNQSLLLGLKDQTYQKLIIQLIKNCSTLNAWKSQIHNAPLALAILEKNKDILNEQDYRDLNLQLLQACSAKKGKHEVQNINLAFKLLVEHESWLLSATPKSAYQPSIINLFNISTTPSRLETLLVKYGDVIPTELISDKYENSSQPLAKVILDYVQGPGQSREIELPGRS